jgi:hypothetical protein
MMMSVVNRDKMEFTVLFAKVQKRKKSTKLSADFFFLHRVLTYFGNAENFS